MISFNRSTEKTSRSVRAGSTAIAMATAMLTALLFLPAHAVEITPDQVIRQTTTDIISAIQEARGYYDKEPQRFEAKIDEIMSPVIDFRSFARGVMGKYGSKKYEAGLSDAERTQFIARVDTFSDKFKQGLLATYAKGLLSFDGQKIEVPELDEPVEAGKSSTVSQYIYLAEGEKPVNLRYKLRQDAEGNWKVRNVYIQSINLGKVYRNQFASAVRQHGNDIDKVIDSWVVGSTDLSDELK